MLADGPFTDSFMHQFYISVLLAVFLVVNHKMCLHLGFCEFEIFNVNSKDFYVTLLVCGYESTV